MNTWTITRDGEPLAGHTYATENQAYAALLRIQPQSTDWAMRYEGYAIVQDDGEG